MPSMTEALTATGMVAVTSAALAGILMGVADQVEAAGRLAELEKAASCAITVMAVHGYDVTDGTQAVVDESDPALTQDLRPCVGVYTTTGADVTAEQIEAILGR